MEGSRSSERPGRLPVLSGGSFCLAAEISKRHGLRLEAGPFDWLFCSVRDLIHIMKDNFTQFLHSAHYQSLTALTGRSSCLHALYGGKIDRPLFNHKDPTTSEDYLYYRRAVENFRALAVSGAILFVVEEGGEVEELFDDLAWIATAKMPGLVVRALRHRHSERPTTLSSLRAIGAHQLWRIDGSAVLGGVALQNPQDEKMIVDMMLLADQQ